MTSNKTFEEKYKGKQYNQLTIIDKESGDTSPYVLYVMAHCSACGNDKKMLLNNIVYGFSRTCGCGQRLASSTARRNGAKIVVETPKGPKSLRWVADYINEPYAKIYGRWRIGRKTFKELISPLQRKPQVRKPNERLNGLTTTEAAQKYGVSKQVVSNRLRIGWIINAKGKWVSPSKGTVGTKVFRMSKKKRKQYDKRNYMKKLYE